VGTFKKKGKCVKGGKINSQNTFVDISSGAADFKTFFKSIEVKEHAE
jgi:hypothetical protein